MDAGVIVVVTVLMMLCLALGGAWARSDHVTEKEAIMLGVGEYYKEDGRTRFRLINPATGKNSTDEADKAKGE